MKGGTITMPEMASMHEILSFKNTCAAKSLVFQQLATDERLKKLLETDATIVRLQLKDIQNVLKQTNTVS